MNVDFPSADELVKRNGQIVTDSGMEDFLAEGGLMHEQVQRLLNRISLMESTLLQRQEEIEQTRRALEDQKREAAAYKAAAEALSAKCDEADAWVFKLSGERQSAEMQLRKSNARRHQIEQENASLLSAKNIAIETAEQLKESLAQETRDKVSILDEFDQHRVNFEQEITRLKESLTSEIQEKIRAQNEAHTHRANYDSLGHMHATSQQEIGRLNDCLGQEHQEKLHILEESGRNRVRYEALENAHRDLQQEVEHLQAKHHAVTAAVSEQNTMIEGLSSEIRQRRQKMQAQHDIIDWLCVVATETQRSRRWWFLLSKEKRIELMAERLSEIGLFDGQSYLARYPDVTEAGLNPLHHYLAHGIREHRQR